MCVSLSLCVCVYVCVGIDSVVKHAGQICEVLGVDTLAHSLLNTIKDLMNDSQVDLNTHIHTHTELSSIHPSAAACSGGFGCRSSTKSPPWPNNS